MQVLRAVQTVTMPTNFKEKDKGVAYERLDRSTRCFIQALFAEHTRGFTFFASLLANAVIKHYMLPGMPKGMEEDVAVVNVAKGYVELSQRLSLSYDTTHMYTLVFRALGLLYIETQGKQMTIIIPLGVYRSPAGLGNILRQLQVRYRDRRPKVRRLINNIIERITSLIPIEQEACEQQPYLDELLARLKCVLSAQGVSDSSGQIALGILTEIAPLVIEHAETQAVRSEEEIDMYLPRFYQVRGLEVTTSYQQESPSTQGENQVEETPVVLNLPGSLPGERTTSRATGGSRECGRFCMPNLSDIHPGGKSESITASATSTRSTAQGRFNPKNLLSIRQAGEVAKEGFAECGRFAVEHLSADQQAGEAFHNVSESADPNLPTRVDSGQIHPLNNGIGNGKKNNSKNTNDISVPDPVLQASTSAVEQRIPDVLLPIAHPSIRHQALALAMLIECNDQNVGAFVELLRKHDQQAIRAGAIATLLRKHFPAGRRALRAPGGYFTRQVQRFQDALPEQMMELLETYAQAPYEEIDAALEKQAHAQTVHQQSAVSLVSQPASYSRRGKPIDEAMATKLARRIAAEDPYVQVRGTCKMPGGTYAVKVFIDPVEYHYRSVEDWEIYHTEMQSLDQEAVSR